LDDFTTFSWFCLGELHRKRSISRSFSITSIATLSNAAAAFRIDSREVGEPLFSANSFTMSPPRFGVQISEVARSGIAGRLATTTHREFRGLATFLGYKPVAFHPD
jgi:hypothetical protein